MKKRIASLLFAAALLASVLAGCNKAPDKSKSLPDSVENPPISEPAEEQPVQTVLTVSTAGTITPQDNIKEVIIEADGVTLENATLDKVTISDKLGEGNATLNNVKAKSLIINGGGANSVYGNASSFDEVVLARKDGATRFVLDESSASKSIVLKTQAVLEVMGEAARIEIMSAAQDSKLDVKAGASVSEISVNAKAELSIASSIESLALSLEAEGSNIDIAQDAKVTTLATDVPVVITGSGEIEQAITNNRNNLDSEIKPSQTTIAQMPVIGGKPVMPEDEPINTTPVVNKPTPTPPASSSKPSTPTTPDTPAPPAPVVVSSIAVKPNSTKTTYIIPTNGTSKVTLTDLVVILSYSDKTSKEVAYANFAANDITISPAHDAVLTSGANNVTITHTKSGNKYVLVITAIEQADAQTQALAPINAATDAVAMQTAIEGSFVLLEINSTTYNQLSAASKTAVATVVFNDRSGNYTKESFVSKFTTEIAARISEISAVSITPNAAQVLENNAAGNKLTASATVSNNTDSTTTLTWYKNTANNTNTTGLTPVATGAEFTPPAQAEGGTYYYFVVATISGNGVGEMTSATVKVTTKAKATGTVVISGDAKFGETLTADITDTNLASEGGTVSYQWKADGVDISSATSAAYGLTKADIGKTITCVVSSDSVTGTLTSAATAAVTKADGPTAPKLGEAATDAISFLGGEATITPTIGTGLTATAYEYSLDNGETWTALTSGTNIENLEAGTCTIIVREKETDTHFAGETASTPVTVKAITYTVTVTLQKDGQTDAATNPSIYLAKGEEEIAMNGTDGVFTAKAADGEYKILFGASKEDTGVTVTVNKGAITATVETFTVTFSVSDASGQNLSANSTIAAVIGDTPFTSGDAVLKGKTVVITATGVGENANSFTYAWTPNTENTSNVYTLEVTEKTTVACTVTGHTLPESEITLTTANTTKTYGDAAFDIQYTDITDKGNGAITFASSAEAVATVDTTGKVTIVGAGSATITVTKAASTGFAKTDKTFTLTVDKKALTVTNGNLAVDAKVYDKTTTATITQGTALGLTGMVESDDVTLSGAPTATFANANVSDTVAVTIGTTDLSLAGTNAANYKLPDGLTITGITGKITPKQVTLVKADNAAVTTKTYDGNTDATLSEKPIKIDGVISGDTVGFANAGTITAVFANKDASANKTVNVTVTGATIDNTNYKLPDGPITVNGINGEITAKALTVTGITAQDKVYDGETTATLNIGSATLVDIIEGDAVTLSMGEATAAFADANVGADKEVTVSGAFALDDVDSVNYTLTQPTLSLTATITKAEAAITAVDKNVIYAADTTINVSTGVSVTGDGVLSYAVEAQSPAAGELDVDGTTLKVTKAGTFTITVTAATSTNHNAATKTYTLTVEKGTQTAPSGLSGEAPTTEGGTNGKITGFTEGKDYEYLSGEEYVSLTATTELAAGEYAVRLAGNDLFNASEPTKVTVPVYEAPIT